jgi:ferrous iron transport protein B
VQLDYPAAVSAALTELSGQTQLPQGTLIRLLEGDACLNETVAPEIATRAKTLCAEIQTSSNEEIDILLADARFRFIQHVVAVVTQQMKHVGSSWTQRIDNIVLNRVLGIPIFLGVMYLLFVFAINVGGAFQDFFDLSSQAIFVDSIAYWLTQWHAPAWLVAVLADGIGKGINTTLTFVPVIGAMFLFMAFLEDSGYMARAAFVVDRAMRTLGLPGKAFVPMIVGFGCNVPAVMAARTLDNRRDRIITVMMSPFMSCGARLAIYAVFTAAFFPVGGQNVVFALYLIGVLAAVMTGFVLRKTVLPGEPAPLLMELPTYHMPQMKSMLLHAWQRLSGFVLRAGTLIVPICALFGVLSIVSSDGRSLLSIVGTWLVPVFSPLGIHADNWPAAVGLLTGVLAKEVVIGTLNTLYAQMGHFSFASAGEFHFLASMQAAWQTIPENLSQLGGALANPVLAKAPMTPLNQNVYGLMAQRFDGQVGAFAYLLFVLLYFPCVSTLAAMLRELPRRWAIFSAVWTTGIAYCIAVMFYQTATFADHHWSSVLWLSAMSLALVIAVAIVRVYGDDHLVLNKEAA